MKAQRRLSRSESVGRQPDRQTRLGCDPRSAAFRRFGDL